MSAATAQCAQPHVGDGKQHLYCDSGVGRPKGERGPRQLYRWSANVAGGIRSATHVLLWQGGEKPIYRRQTVWMVAYFQEWLHHGRYSFYSQRQPSSELEPGANSPRLTGDR